MSDLALEMCRKTKEDLRQENLSLRAQLAEHESNQRAYEEIIGKKTYREVADEIASARTALEHCQEYVKRRHNANIGWWNDNYAFETMESVIKPALKGISK